MRFGCIDAKEGGGNPRERRRLQETSSSSLGPPPPRECNFPGLEHLEREPLVAAAGGHSGEVVAISASCSQGLWLGKRRVGLDRAFPNVRERTGGGGSGTSQPLSAEGSRLSHY